jgi:RimJ/RimL family protein N-acetyltransferase
VAGFADTEEARAYGASLLVGERVCLRAPREEDVPVLAAWYRLPEWAVLQRSMLQPLTAQIALEEVRKWGKTTDGTGAGFSVERCDSGELIGQVELWGATVPTRAATFAIMLGPEHASLGYGAEATRLMLGFGFRELNLNRIELHAWSFNTRAIRAYEKAGFTIEGRRREAVFHDGSFHDELIMGILASEFLGS